MKRYYLYSLNFVVINAVIMDFFLPSLLLIPKVERSNLHQRSLVFLHLQAVVQTVILPQ